MPQIYFHPSRACQQGAFADTFSAGLLNASGDAAMLPNSEGHHKIVIDVRLYLQGSSASCNVDGVPSEPAKFDMQGFP